MKIADFRIQTTVPDAPSAGVVGLYANASGILTIQTSAGAISSLGLPSTGATNLVAQTGSATVKIFTGSVFGGGGSAMASGLANPAVWVPITYNGSGYVLPAYAV